MKTVFMLFLSFVIISGYAQTSKKNETVKKVSFTVKGACGHCKERIEKTAKSVKGVKTAEWNSEFQMITVTYDTTKTDLPSIHKAIAAAGHDTELIMADDKVYKKLPGCCKYRQ